jgi:hypothetical protein
LIKNYDTGKYATDSPDHDWLWFEGYSEATEYCFITNGEGYYELQDQTTGNCLAVDTSDNNEIEEEGCAPYYLWEEWDYSVVAESGQYSVVLLHNGIDDESECLYDYKQEPAVATGCIYTDEFEWFTLIGGG